MYVIDICPPRRETVVFTNLFLEYFRCFRKNFIVSESNMQDVDDNNDEATVRYILEIIRIHLC